jgi:hypothetical protein
MDAACNVQSIFCSYIPFFSDFPHIQLFHPFKPYFQLTLVIKRAIKTAIIQIYSYHQYFTFRGNGTIYRLISIEKIIRKTFKIEIICISL